jgi:hypothetical protein
MWTLTRRLRFRLIGPLLRPPTVVTHTRRFSNISTAERLIPYTAPTSLFYDDFGTSLDKRSELSNAALVRLVEEGKYGAADRLRLQLEENGVVIKRNVAYKEAALAALQWQDPSTVLDHFSAWFSLIPYIDEHIDESGSTDPIHPIRTIRKTLLQSGSPANSLPLLKCFAILCASKGYTNPIFREIANIVVQFSTPPNGATFLLDFEEAFRVYQQNRHPENARRTTTRQRITTIEICCQAGWLDEATKILQLHRDFALPDQTYTLLLRLCRDKQKTENVRTIEDLRMREFRDRLTLHTCP